MNLLSEMTDPMHQKVQYFYDLQGRLIKEIDRKG
jgi:YD repeat-containing protein